MYKVREEKGKGYKLTNPGQFWMERRCGPNFWKKGLITVVKEVQRRIFLVYKFFPLANLVSPPLIIDSPSALVPSPHN